MSRTFALLLIAPMLAAGAGMLDDIAAGAKLTQAQAVALEGKPTLADRHRLLGWYAAHPDVQYRDKRVALILSLAQQGALGRLATHSAAHIQREGGSPLASPEGYAKVKTALIERAAKSKLPLDQSNAAWFVFPEEPDIAVGMAAEQGLMRDTGTMAAQYLLGLVHPDGRSSPFGRSLRQLVAGTPDPLFQFAFGVTLRDLGAQRYAAGGTEWDYTAQANEALGRAAKAEPQQTGCSFVPAVLPARGASIAPPPPDSLPASTGGAIFHAIIGCSGYAVSLEWLAGPAASVSTAKREIATRQFEVPLHDGRPIQSLVLAAAGAKGR